MKELGKKARRNRFSLGLFSLEFVKDNQMNVNFAFPRAFFVYRRLTSVNSCIFIFVSIDFSIFSFFFFVCSLQFCLRLCSHHNSNININQRQKEMRQIFLTVVHSVWWASLTIERERKIPLRNKYLIEEWLIFFLFAFLIVCRNWLVEPVKNKIGKL